MSPKALGGEIVGSARAFRAWRDLAIRRELLGLVVEASEQGQPSRMIGFACGIFVSSAFAAGELANPQPAIVSRLIAQMSSGDSPVLTLDEVRRGNTIGGLSFLILNLDWLRHDVSAEQLARMRMQMATGGMALLRGYRYRQVIREALDAEQAADVVAQQTFRLVASFPASGRALFVTELAEAIAVPGSVASILFAYQEPVLGLGDHAQELLLAALAGGTDAELAGALGLSVAAVKKRWQAVFTHVERTNGHLLSRGEPVAAVESAARGLQKRHLLLAYVREHPEELRPRLANRHAAKSARPTVRRSATEL